jgi:hypothetical protein
VELVIAETCYLTKRRFQHITAPTSNAGRQKHLSKMNKAHYIIFHPDHARQQTPVRAIAMVQGQVLKNWSGNIYVDRIGIGNEDPFVFNAPWLYSYCHASQLRRNFRQDNNYLQSGSKIFFVSGQQADQGLLTIDTVFLIGGVQPWDSKPTLHLPTKYQNHFQNNKSILWRRHFRFPFQGSHITVSHTYEAALWQENKTDFSFLPLNESNERVSVPFDEFPNDLLKKIAEKVKGKYPVLLTDSEINIIATQLEKRVTTKILKITASTLTVTSKKGRC